MNQDLNVLLLSDDRALISWDKGINASAYQILGMNNLFVNQVIARTDSCQFIIPLNQLKQYLRICVNYIYQDNEEKKEIVLGSSKEWEVKTLIEKDVLEKLEIHCISSYDGYTFSFYGDTIFERYYVYEKKNDGDYLILETEDFQVTSSQFILGNEYYVEAYQKNDSTYVLKAKSEIFSCKAQEITPSEAISLSIVVPVFNGETFLARTLDSLLLSSFQEKEIILVNDGSTDKTKEIIDWYLKKYPNLFQYYEQEKKGVSFARNLGLRYVKGEYVAFLDSDDLVHPYMYEKLYQLAYQNDLDVAISKTFILDDIHERSYCLDVKKNEYKENLLYSFEEMFQEYDKNTYDNIFFVAIWNKIMKTSIAKEHLFPSFNLYEDTAFTMTAYSYAEKFGFCKKAYYVWDKRFRKTVGTYSTTYKDVDSESLNRYYVQALFHVSKEGNPERLEYVVYYSIIELYNYLTKVKYDLYHNKFADSYIHEIQCLGEKLDLLKNPFIQANKMLLSFVTNILNMK